MSSDLIALIVGLTLGTAVVILGLKRNLSETTRDGLRQFGRGPERPGNPTLGLYEGEERRRRPASPRQRRWLASIYLLSSLAYGALAVLSANDRLLHSSVAGMFALAAVIFMWQGFGSRQRPRG